MLTFLIVAYFIPLVLSLLYMTVIYFHVNGKFSNIVQLKYFNDVDRAMFLCTLAPFVNIYIALQWIQDFPIQKQKDD